MPEQILGHYRLTSQLGAGGMGVVYRATDTRLERQVAIKLLHEESLNDPGRLARFEREARLLASLNHTNIAAIHGLEEAGTVKFLVLEYVPGDTLAQRLTRGPLPLKEALDLGRQVANALASAHEAGIIHRDLKPANIKITPEGKVKVLDFGLAKALEDARPAGPDNATRTTDADRTEPGVVMGTAPYMSPEQASGKPVDRRTDIWAFGCILYESLSGKRSFPGNSTTEVLVAILDREPSWEALPAGTPDNVKRLLRRCLAKDPDSRLHHIADARLELEDTLSGRLSGAPAASAPRATRRRVWAGLAAGMLFGAAAAGLLFWRFARSSGSPRVVRFSFDLPAGTRIAPSWRNQRIVFSPDSRTLLFRASGPKSTVLHSRRIDEIEAKPFPGGQSYSEPVYSPDNRWVAIADTSKGSLVKLPLSGGAPVPVTEIEMPFMGDWGSDGFLYWTNQLIGGLIRTPENGGPSQPVTEPDAARQERSHRYAKLLPGGKAVLFTVAAATMDTYDDARIDVLDLATRKRKTLVEGGTFARYAPSGHIVYARGGSLYAVAFDSRTLEVSGTPVKVLDGVLMSANIGMAYFDISRNGDLAYAPGPAENGERSLTWVDRQGKETPVPLPARSYLNPRLSPDGKLLAVEVEGLNHDFYIYDFARAVMSRITNNGTSHAPIWTPDGTRLAFRTWSGGKMGLAWMPADRSGPEEKMVNYTAWQSAVSFSPDGKFLSFDQIEAGMTPNLFVLPISGDRTPRPLVRANFPVGAGKFSPDGKWVIYCSLESGRPEVYVQPWPGPGPKIQVSSDGGTDPVWRRDGKEIFYRNGNKMMAVPVSTHGSFQAGRTQVLFEGEYTFGLSSSCGFKGVTTTSYDVSLDGQRFLMIKDRDQNTYATKIVVVLNWIKELEQIMANSAGQKQ